jgi:stage V sporulation protein SpoVS
MAKYEAKKAFPGHTFEVEVYVPNRDRDGALVHNHAQWVALVEGVVCSLTGGGCTTYEAVGTWDGAKEQTTVVRGAVAGSYRDAQAALAQAVGAFAAETNQAVGGWTVDGQWFWAAPVVDDATQPGAPA